MVYVYKYEVSYWDDVESEEKIEGGVVCAETFHEAVERLERYYGENGLMSINYLEGFDFGGEYILTDEALRELGYTKTE